MNSLMIPEYDKENVELTYPELDTEDELTYPKLDTEDETGKVGIDNQIAEVTVELINQNSVHDDCKPAETVGRSAGGAEGIASEKRKGKEGFGAKMAC